MGMIMHDDVPYGEGTSYTQGTGIAINNNVIAVDADNTPTKNSEKPVKSKGVYSALESNRDESTSLLKSTVGWTGKNLLKNTASSQTINGVTFTVNDDKSVTVSGTASANAFLTIGISTKNLRLKSNTQYTLSGCPSGGATDTYKQDFRTDTGSTTTVLGNDVGSGVTFTTPNLNNVSQYQVVIRIQQGYTANNLVFYPMIRDASITDDTYEPYHESVEEEIEQIYADNGVLGAKNLLPNNATSQTKAGITFKVNADGTITANGTATADANFTIANAISVNEPMILSGCPKNGSDSTYRLIAQVGSSYLKDYGEGLLIDSNITQIYIQIKSGQTVNNLVFKPMFRLASDPDDTYVPYAMTNREITEELTVQESAVTDIISGATAQDNHLYKYGKVVQLALTITGVTATAHTSIIAKIPEGFRPKCITDLAVSGDKHIYVSPGGNVLARQDMNNKTCLGSATWITD